VTSIRRPLTQANRKPKGTASGDGFFVTAKVESGDHQGAAGEEEMTDSFRKGMRVKWNWGQGIGRGRVAERFDRHVERTIEGALIRRNGSASNPAYLVQTDNGSEVLKLASELSRA